MKTATRIEATNDFVIKFANVNGSGSASANELFAKAFLRMGIELAEQPQVLRTLRPWLVVPGRARHSQQFALPLNAQVRVVRIDPWAFVFSR